MIKTLSITPVDIHSLQLLMRTIYTLQNENKIVDYREYNNGVQIIYKDDEDLNYIEKHLNHNIQTELMLS
jgi:hypothetical protein